MRCKLIVNPKSGPWDVRRELPAVLSHLSDHDWRTSVHNTEQAGEATALDHLASATAAFRSRRSGALSCIGDAAFPAPQATLNGLWWQRSALVSFEYRYQG